MLKTACGGQKRPQVTGGKVKGTMSSAMSKSRTHDHYTADHRYKYDTTFTIKVAPPE